MSASVIRAHAASLPLPDGSVDLIVTSPPYFGLRSYTDGGEHYPGQIGSEATPTEWLEALWACTREWVRVLKPEGSLFVNLGDKYAGSGPGSVTTNAPNFARHFKGGRTNNDGYRAAKLSGGQPKSLLGLPWRYALGCTDQLGLILRAEIIWAKPNGLPESVTDRVRRAHEQVFHFTRQPRYYAAVDEIREPQTGTMHVQAPRTMRSGNGLTHRLGGTDGTMPNPLGKLPGSVWSIPSQPLIVPPQLGIDHFACVDEETEILTSLGWLRHWELNPGTVQVAGYDLDTNTARWTDCTAVNRYDYDGDLIAVESRDLSMRLTPNHRTIVQRMHTRNHKRSPLAVVRADELDYRHFIPRSAAWTPSGDFTVGDRTAALMGWVAAEGWYQGGCVYLSQSLEANAPYVADIDKLTTYEWRTEKSRTYKGRPWTEVTWKVGWLAELIQREMPDKLLPWWLVTASPQERRAALDAFVAGDGHRRPDGRISIFQKHRRNLDVLQAIAVTLGYKTTLREGGGRFVLYLTEGGRSVTLRGTSGVGSKVRREHYKGVVWCPTTGTGTFIARRNGSVFVTGNSFPMELPRRVILGWSPPGVCTACGQGRRPVVDRANRPLQRVYNGTLTRVPGHGRQDCRNGVPQVTEAAITGYACACGQSQEVRSEETISPQAEAMAAPSGETLAVVAEGLVPELRKISLPPTRPAVVLDPFGGTGTTALVASVLGRHGVTADLSADYGRLARWRVNDPGERARAMQVPKPPPIPDGQEALFTL